MAKRSLVPVRVLKTLPGGELNAGEVGGFAPDRAAFFIRRGYAAPYEPEPAKQTAKAEEPQPKKRRKRPKGLDVVDRMTSSEVEKAEEPKASADE